MPSSTGCVQSSVNFSTCFFFLPPFAAGFFCGTGREKSGEGRRGRGGGQAGGPGGGQPGAAGGSGREAGQAGSPAPPAPRAARPGPAEGGGGGPGPAPRVGPSRARPGRALQERSQAGPSGGAGGAEGSRQGEDGPERTGSRAARRARRALTTGAMAASARGKKGAPPRAHARKHSRAATARAPPPAPPAPTPPPGRAQGERRRAPCVGSAERSPEPSIPSGRRAPPGPARSWLCRRVVRPGRGTGLRGGGAAGRGRGRSEGARSGSRRQRPRAWGRRAPPRAAVRLRRGRVPAVPRSCRGVTRHEGRPTKGNAITGVTGECHSVTGTHLHGGCPAAGHRITAEHRTPSRQTPRRDGRPAERAAPMTGVHPSRCNPARPHPEAALPAPFSPLPPPRSPRSRPARPADKNSRAGRVRPAALGPAAGPGLPMAGGIFSPLGSYAELEQGAWHPLVCLLCHGPFQQPCLLDCYHAFCASCLRGRAASGRLRCPLCGYGRSGRRRAWKPRRESRPALLLSPPLPSGIPRWCGAARGCPPWTACFSSWWTARRRARRTRSAPTATGSAPRR